MYIMSLLVAGVCCFAILLVCVIWECTNLCKFTSSGKLRCQSKTLLDQFSLLHADWHMLYLNPKLVVLIMTHKLSSALRSAREEVHPILYLNKGGELVDIAENQTTRSSLRCIFLEEHKMNSSCSV